MLLSLARFRVGRGRRSRSQLLAKAQLDEAFLRFTADGEIENLGVTGELRTDWFVVELDGAPALIGNAEGEATPPQRLSGPHTWHTALDRLQTLDREYKAANKPTAKTWRAPGPPQRRRRPNLLRTISASPSTLELVSNALRQTPGATLLELARVTGVSTATVNNAIHKLIQEGYAWQKRQGCRRAVYFYEGNTDAAA